MYTYIKWTCFVVVVLFKVWNSVVLNQMWQYLFVFILVNLHSLAQSSSVQRCQDDSSGADWCGWPSMLCRNTSIPCSFLTSLGWPELSLFLFWLVPCCWYFWKFRMMVLLARLASYPENAQQTISSSIQDLWSRCMSTPWMHTLLDCIVVLAPCLECMEYNDTSLKCLPDIPSPIRSLFAWPREMCIE